MAYAERDYLELSPAAAREQWSALLSRRRAPAGKNQVPFVPIETLLCLATMFVVDHSRFGSTSAGRAPSPVPELARLFKRPPTSIIAKMANLDGSRSHGARFDLVAGSKLRMDPGHLAEICTVILTTGRDLGVGPEALPDFLGLETGAPLELLGQEELGSTVLESYVDAELDRWLARQEDLDERDTERLMRASARVGQHRFAASVLTNCGNACVFCGFTLADGRRHSLLRARHIKPWKDSSGRERLQVENGLAACAMHDAAFDAGLISLDDKLHVVRSRRLEQSMQRNASVRRFFDPAAITDQIVLPQTAAPPDLTYVAWHRTNLFAGSTA